MNTFVHLWISRHLFIHLITDSAQSDLECIGRLKSSETFKLQIKNCLSQVYVSDFNIFYKPGVTAAAVQVTHNGKKDEILNGIPDWVYEGEWQELFQRCPCGMCVSEDHWVCVLSAEEVFASNGAIWWSSTGKFFAYLELNDTDVHKVEFSWYGSEQYPQTVAVPYPKVGERSS